MIPQQTRFSFEYVRHLGPRFESAGLVVEVYDNDNSIIFTCSDRKFEKSEYYPYALRGFISALSDDIEITNIRIHIHSALVHDVDSSPVAFQNCAYQVMKTMMRFNDSAQQVDAPEPASPAR
jgi:hypothetical protein